MAKHELQLLEERLLDPATRASTRVLDELIDDDFVEFGASGRVWSKPDVLAELPGQRALGAFTIADFHALALGDGFVLATYRLTLGGKGETSLRSSLWRRDGAGWRLRFHQGTTQP